MGMILKETMVKNFSELKKYLHSPNQMQILNPNRRNKNQSAPQYMKLQTSN